jgi:elongation factor G
MKLAEEDPTFTEKYDNETEETVISGMGELHLDIIVDRLRREFGIPVECGQPEVAYRETCTVKVQHEEKLKKQTGGHGQYAHVIIEMESSRNCGYVFENNVKGGDIPKEYIPAIEKGLKEGLDAGPVAGYPVVDVKINLLDGSFHPVDSSEMAFKIATRGAFRAAMAKAKPELLEPIMNIVLEFPDEYTGTIQGDLNSRRGRILGMDIQDGLQLLTAELPLAEVYGYPQQLRSMTQGRGSFVMKFDRYDPVPPNIAKKIQEEAAKEDAEEE